MEDRLKRLVETNNEKYRLKWATECKKQGKKVIGIMSSHVPEEVISAAGMLPWRITGTWHENVSHASVYRAESSCAYCLRVLESSLNGELDFLDGIVVTDQDDDIHRTWDILVYLNKVPFYYMMHSPIFESERNNRFFGNEIRGLISRLEKFGGVKINENSLRSSIDTYNIMRDLLGKVYELRKRETPPLSGAEILGITTAAQIMPKEQFNYELETLLPYLEKRKANLKQVHPRLLVSSDMLDNPAYLSLVEETSLVAMDDMDTGSRYFIQNVDTTLEDPIYALSERYQGRHSGPRMAHWNKQIDQLTKWVNDYRIDGVLSLPLAWCYPQQFRMPYLSRKLKEVNVPHISLDREYHLANIGQLRTRIGAFVEMLSVK